MPGIPAAVINLVRRTDRLARFRQAFQHWSFEPLLLVNGVEGPPHLGCGIAHIKAIRQGLALSPVVLVLEDDAEPLPHAKEQICHALRIQHAWDACNLGATQEWKEPVKGKQLGDFVLAEPSFSLRSAHAVLWQRSALPLLAEYEALLQKGHVVPIDRFLFAPSWNTEEYARRGESIECLETRWTAGRVAIALSPSFRQRPEEISDQTGKLTGTLNFQPLERDTSEL